MTANTGNVRTLLLVLTAAALGGCGGDGKQGKSRTITIKGSDTMVILGQRWAEIYMGKNPGTAIQITGGGSGTGIAALINGGTDICESSRPMKDKEKDLAKKKHGKDVVETPVALDGLAIFLHESNPVQELSLEQLEGIYRGRITDWKVLGGSPGRIVCYSRENNSGTYAYFKEHVLNDKDFAPDVQTLPGTAAVINAVSKDPASIGYGGIGYDKGVKAIRVKAKDGDKAVDPSMENVVAGIYPISRKLYFYTIGEPAGDVKTFIDWVLSDAGQKVCGDVGYYPLARK
jgi:phosphate transport system substrate-binding protein